MIMTFMLLKTSPIAVVKKHRFGETERVIFALQLVTFVYAL